jgi:hypothetical protein
MEVTLNMKEAKDDIFIKTTIPHTEFQHFPKNLDKSIEEILTNKNVKEQTLERDIVLVLCDFLEHLIYLI